MDRRDFLAAGALCALEAMVLKQALAQGGSKSARDFASLSQSVRSAAGAPVTVNVEGVVEIPTDFTIPGNCVLNFTQGGKLVVGRDAKVLLDGPIKAGDWAIFDGPGAVMGGKGNGSVRSTWFGAVGDDATDNAQALLRTREFLRYSPGPKTITFPKGTYRYSRNEWVKGIRELEINAEGARFLNIRKGPGYGFEEHPFVGNWGTFSTVGYASYSPGSLFFGYLIQSARKGASQVVCSDKPAEDHFRPGNAVLVYGYGQQATSYPPNPRYFEYHTVESYDRATATVRLARPLRYDYDGRWHDFAQGKGAPRVLPLDRADFAWGRRLVINGGDFLQNPEHKGNSVQITGYAQVVLNRVRLYRLTPGIVDSFRVDGCEIDNVESDKIIRQLAYHSCNIGTHTAASGVELLTFTGGTRITRSFETAARSTVFDDVEFQSVGARGHRVCLSLNVTYAQRSVHFKYARVVVSNPEIVAVMNGGGEITFTVASVLNGRTVLVRAADDKESQPLTQGLHAGFIYTTAGGKKCTLVNVYRHDPAHLAVEGEFSGTPQPGDAYKGGNVDELRVEKLVQSGSRPAVPVLQRRLANKINVPG
jgi:hypothetical protein